MAQTETSSDLTAFIDEHGEVLARFFALLVDDPLDAEDLFHAEVFRLFARHGAVGVSRPAVFRSALARSRRHARLQSRSHYRPVEIDGEGRAEGRGVEALRRAWRRVPLLERSAVALLVGFEQTPREVSSLLGKRSEDPLAAAEHGLLLFERERAMHGRLPVFPRGRERGDLLRSLLEAPGDSAPEPNGRADRIERETASALRAYRLLHRAILRPADWRKMRRRVLRDLPVSGGTLLFDSFETPFGWFSAASLEGVVVGSAFGRRSEQEWLRAVGPSVARGARSDPRSLRGPRRELEEYFAGRGTEFTFPWRLVGVSAFRAAVLDACARIPYGAVRSYKHLAKAVGRPAATRAVGGALSRNPLPVVVPCHRVITRTGLLGGFSAGIALKERLLSLEGMGDLFAPRP
ncbi:MAG: methylated-DNA--[protein]-cysteine S-methyltransferase [Candidatus Eisenbacteria bacterium]